MKKVCIILGVLLAAGITFCVFGLQPLKVQNEDHYRWTVQLGKTVYLESIDDMAGGYRCWLKDGDEYFWLSDDDCTVEYFKKGHLKVVFHLNQPPTIHRKG